jgi:hypothetical protein
VRFGMVAYGDDGAYLSNLQDIFELKFARS